MNSTSILFRIDDLNTSTLVFRETETMLHLCFTLNLKHIDSCFIPALTPKLLCVSLRFTLNLCDSLFTLNTVSHHCRRCHWVHCRRSSRCILSFRKTRSKKNEGTRFDGKKIYLPPTYHTLSRNEKTSFC